MKKHNITLIMALLAMIGAGCKKFIDKPYDNRVSLTSATQIRNLLADAYPVRHDLFTDILTDDFDFHANTAQASNITAYSPMYKWADDYPDGTATGPQNAYAEYNRRIYYANLALENIDNVSGTEQAKSALRGEALLIRSYCHFILVNMFARHYDPATAGSELGVPVVTAVSKDNITFYTRNTVKETYEQIEKDAAEGLEQLKKGGADLSASPYHFTVAAANAFQARIKLYKGEWAKAAEYCDAVIAERGRAIRVVSEDLKLVSAKGEAYFASKYMDPVGHPNILMLYHGATMGPLTPTGFRMAGFYPSDSIRKYLPANDYRSRVTSSVGTVIDNRIIMMKFGTQPNSPNNTPVKTPYFSIEEVLLTRAEALLRANPGTVPALALEDVEALRKLRYATYTPLTGAAATTNEGLLKEVLLERRKEFINEGLRWYDVKRLKIPIEHRMARGAVEVIKLETNDLRTAIQIPRLEQERNPGIAKQLNPR